MGYVTSRKPPGYFTRGYWQPRSPFGYGGRGRALVQWDARSLALPAGATYSRGGGAWVINHEGVLQWRAANEVAWAGVRKVQNLATALTTHSVTVSSAEKYQVTIKGAAGATCVLSGAISMTLTADGVNRITSPSGAPWTAGATTLFMTVTGTLTELQLESCEQRVGRGGIPSEWVNFAVAHNAGVNGVKVFDYLNGNTVDAAGVVTEAPGAAIDTSKIHLLTQPATWNQVHPANCEVTTGKWTTGSPGVASTLWNVVGPNGNTVGTKWTEQAGLGAHTAYRNPASAPALSKHCFSVYAKAGTRNHVFLASENSAFNNIFRSMVVDLTTGETVVPPVDGVDSYGSEYIGNGWWRVWMIRTTDADGGNAVMRLGMVDPATLSSSYTGDGVSHIFLWGAQVERDVDLPTSVINTTTATTARAVDVINFSGVSGYAADNEVRLSKLGAATVNAVDWDGAVDADPNFYGKLRELRLYGGDA
jgi:hypothetical protein